MTVSLYEGLWALPHFNADDDEDIPPPVVADLRRRVGEADGLLFCSPEYAHGVPGSLKNLLDWLVASLEFPNKPVALISASTRATYARASLLETLTTMTARIVPEASVTIDVARGDVDADGAIADVEIRRATREALDALARAIRS